MDRLVFTTVGSEATARCGTALAPALAAGDVMLLTGDLGAGKTQFTKGIAKGLGVAEPVTSPTFNIMLVHEGRLPLYHLDLYRLTKADELLDLDYYATLEGDGVAVVEWGDRFPEAAPSDGLSIELHITGDDERRVEVRALGPRGRSLLDEWDRACATVEDVERIGGDA